MLTCRSALVALLFALSLTGCAKDPEVAKREFVRSGDGYVEQKKFREAIVEYKNAIQQDPQFGEARLKLAKVYLELGEIRNSFHEYVRAADLMPNIVLLGIGLVQNNGERALAEIAMRLPGTKILIVANSVNDPIARACLRWGAHDVLGKPISFDSVRGKVGALLDRREISPTMLGLLPQSAAW